MKRRRCCLASFIFVCYPVADGFTRLVLSHRHVQSRAAAGIRGGVRTPSRAAEERGEGDSRIASDPDALEEWFSNMGGVVGPVALEGKWVGHG